MKTSFLSNSVANIGLGLATMTPNSEYPPEVPAPPPRIATVGGSASDRRQDAQQSFRSIGKPALQRLLEHVRYLKAVSTQGTPPPITPETAAQATRAWWDVWKATGYAMPIPAACTGPDGQMSYSWDRGKHHLELEITPGQPAVFFYRDRQTGHFWGDEYMVGDPLPDDVVQRLRLFV